MAATTTTTKLSPAQYAARTGQRPEGHRPAHRRGQGHRAAKNARTHGLCSLAPVLPGEDPTEFEQMLAQWTKEMTPGNPDERRMVYDMVCATRAADRVRKADVAAALVRMRKAGEAFDAERAASLKDPAYKVAHGGMPRSASCWAAPTGVRELLGLWRGLEEQLDRLGYLDVKQRRLAATWLGCVFDDVDDERAREIHALGMALEVARAPAPRSTPSSSSAASSSTTTGRWSGSRPLIATEVEALRSLLPDLEAEEAELRQQAMDAAAVDTSDEGAPPSLPAGPPADAAAALGVADRLEDGAAEALRPHPLRRRERAGLDPSRAPRPRRPRKRPHETNRRMTQLPCTNGFSTTPSGSPRPGRPRRSSSMLRRPPPPTPPRRF